MQTEATPAKDLEQVAPNALYDLEDLAREIAEAASPIPAIREALRASSKLLDEFFLQGVDIRALVHGRAYFMDQILSLLWNRHEWRDKDDISLIAVGGYGRGELHPHSDIDLLIVSREALSEEYQAAVSEFVTSLWDLRLDIGHSVRTLEECIKAARDDITIATNLLETRTVCGNDILREMLSSRVYADEVCTDRAYFLAKREEQRARHEKYGDTEYNLEPNLKSSPGALRDIQTVAWITKRHFGLSCTTELGRYNFLTDDELQTLRKGELFLWKLRYGLQMIANRNENRLLFDHQRTLAKLLAYEGDDIRLAVERMMQEYYRVVLVLAELIEVSLQHFDEAILGSETEAEVITLNKRFQLRNGYIEAKNGQVFAYAPYALLEVFLLMAQNPDVRGVRATTIRALRAHRHLIDDNFRADIRNTTLFMELLRTPHPLHKTLSAMKRYGILGRYLPEFGNVIGQMQHDLFHIYTVDAHTLKVIRGMVKLREPGNEREFPLASRLIHRLPKLQLLYIAGLYHDIAKGRGGDHSELGAVDVQRFCKTHRLSERDTQLVAWLVENHLLMSMTSQRKDISDPDIIQDFARQMPSQVHLDYLYVLTVTDIKATNPKLWNTWRATLLRQLHLETERALRRGTDNPLDRNYWIAATRAEAREMLVAQNFTDEQISSIWNKLEDDYFLQASTTEIAWQTASIISHEGNAEPLVMIRDSQEEDGHAYTQILLYLPANENLFAATTAVLEQLNLNIVDARISSSGGPFCLSSYIVLDEHNRALASDLERKQRIQLRLLEELDDPDDYPEIIQRRTPRQLKHFAFPTEVTLSNDTVNQRTLLEIITPDRPGLLARIALIFLEHGVELVNAKIATLGERVEDVFFITDKNGEPLSDPAVCQALQQNLCEQLDEQAQSD